MTNKKSMMGESPCIVINSSILRAEIYLHIKQETLI